MGDLQKKIDHSTAPIERAEKLALAMSDNQMHFTSETWGLTTFFPTKDDKWANNCRHCIINRSEECLQAPCTPEERHDGQRGYFSIKDFPDGTQNIK